MTSRRPAPPPAEQLLGEIETRIVGMQYYDAAVNPGDTVHLEREPNNRHDASAIRVENSLFEPVGHVPRRVCSWLAPLIDAGKIRVDGCVPTKNSGGSDGREVDSDSPSGTTCPLTLTDGYEAAKEELQKYREKMKLPQDAAGVLVTHGDRVVGMDLFDSPATLESLWERLSDAYFFDALRDAEPKTQAQTETAEQFLQAVAERAKPRVPALGLGDELEIAGDTMVGGALFYDDRICHLAAFSEAGG